MYELHVKWGLYRTDKKEIEFYATHLVQTRNSRFHQHHMSNFEDKTYKPTYYLAIICSFDECYAKYT
jgi:hypothetical protein